MRFVLRVGAGVAAAGLTLVLWAPAASAHPLGNFTSNTYAGLRVAPDHVAIDYVLDLAEIPAQQAMPTIDTDGDGTVSDSESVAYVADECAALAAGLELRVGDHLVEIGSAGGTLSFPPGLAGLSILRLECDLSTEAGSIDSGDAVSFHDGNLADRIGWHEITAVGDGTTLLDSTVPTTSVSDRLVSYPDGVRSLQVRDAQFSVTAGGDRAAAVDDATQATPERSVPGGDRATRLFASLISDHRFTVGFGLVAVAIAMVLGAFHALAPGHGKTVMAAYVIGRRGGVRHAVGIGAAVAVTHTVGVLLLGLVLWSSEALAPERVYPVLGVASGLLVAAVGLGLFVRVLGMARSGTPVVGHSHGTGPGQHTHPWLERLEAEAHDRELVLVGAGAPAPVHEHHGHDHNDHDHHHHDEPPPLPAQPLGWGGILAMGVAGGMVPSPSALIVLLGALTLGRTWFGVTLVLAYGVGMALTLLAAGLILVKAQNWIEPRLRRRAKLIRLASALPAVTATLVFGGGLVLAARAAGLF